MVSFLESYYHKSTNLTSIIALETEPSMLGMHGKTYLKANSLRVTFLGILLILDVLLQQQCILKIPTGQLPNQTEGSHTGRKCAYI